MPETDYSIKLPNGLMVVAEHNPAVRSAAFQIIVPSGAITDPEEHQGAATVLEGLTYRGAGSRDARGLSDALDSLGVQRGGSAELEYTTFSAALLADDLHKALEIYGDIILRPHLPEDQLPAERALALQKLERLEDSPSDKLFVNLRKTYYPGSYGRTVLGNAAGLNSLTPDLMRAEHARRFRPDGAILAVAGRFNWSELNETIHRVFGEWQGAAPAQPKAEPAGKAQYVHIPQETNQEQIGVIYPSVPLGHPDFYTMRMGLRVLSGGMGARLFTEVREKRGLCYSVTAYPSIVKGSGAVVAYAGTTPERCQETLDVLLAEIKRLEEGVTEEELARARTGVLSELVMQGETARGRALAIARDQYLLGEIRTPAQIRAGVEAVTTDGIREYLRRNPAGQFTIVTLGPTQLEVAL